MNNVQAFTSKQDIHQQACEWISRLDRGLSKIEKQTFQEWVNISHAHRMCLFDMAQMWDDLSVLNELSTMFPLQDDLSKRTSFFSNRPAISVAASIAFVVLSCFAWLINSTFTLSTQPSPLLVFEAKTTVGEQKVVTLADGSLVHLNTNSMMSVNFSETRRDIQLIKGEAHFEVAHDEQKPFVVKVSQNTVTAVGTAFNVQISPNNVFELLITEGKVLVKNEHNVSHGAVKIDLSSTHNDTGRLMIAGEKALITPQSAVQQTLSKEQMENDLAWQKGMLVFHGEPLTEVLQEISRYTSINFTLADEAVKQRRVAGYFKAGDIQGLLFALKNNFNILYSQQDPQTIILSSGS